jgi:colicin import membrane protein
MVWSGAAHAALLIYAAIGFSSANAFDPPKEALPVEVVSLSEFDQLTKGHQQSTEKQVNKVQAKKVAAVDAKPKEMAPEAKEDVAAPPAPPPPPEVAEPPPEPKPPEPKPPEPKPAEAPPPEPAPTPEPKKAEAEPKPAPPTPAPKPPDLPKPEKKAEKPPEKKPEKKAEKPQPKFDPTKIASLIDKRDPGQKAQEGREVQTATSAGTQSGTAAQLSLSIQSMVGKMLYEQLRGCFAGSAAFDGRTDLVATIEFQLTEQGVLVGQPQLQSSSSDPAFPAFSSAAMRAVYQCTQATNPLRLPAEHYAFWKNPIVDFTP